MLNLMKNLKIISSIAGIINGLSIIKTVLTVGIIVFTVLETVTTLFKINSNELLEG